MLVKPYLPDIIKGCRDRVNASFSARSEDPFTVFFDKGLVMQVKRSIYQSAEQNFPLIWLVMKYDEVFGNPKIYSTASFQIIIAMPTDNNYTQQQREDTSFKPRLLPIADALIDEIARERWFSFAGARSVRCIKTLQPFWGMSQVTDGTGDIPNLWQLPGLFVDAISITFNSVVIRNSMCNNNSYPIIKL